MSVFAISASGLRVAFARHDIRANNIANAVTPGFKASRANVSDVRPGGGAAIGAIQLMLRQGPLELADGSPFALAIDGEGFFEVQTAQGVRYTRAGSFGLDANQQVVMPGTGALAKGVNGSPITVALGGNGPAQATSSVLFGGNLNGGGAAAMNGTLLETNVFTDNTAGTPATASTLLANLSRLPETPGAPVDLGLNSGNVLTFRFNGQEFKFNVGTSLAPGSQGFGTTLGDLAGFMDRSLGLQQGATELAFGAVRENAGVPVQPMSTAMLDTNANGLIDRVQTGQDLVAAGAKVGDVLEFRSGSATGLTASIGGFATTATPNDTIILASEIASSVTQPVAGDQFSIHEPPQVTVGNQTTMSGGGTPQLGNGSQDGRLRIAGNAGTVNQISNAELVGPNGVLTQFFQRRAADGESTTTTVTAFDSIGQQRQVNVAVVLEAKGPMGNRFRALGLSRDNLAVSGNTILGTDRAVGTGTLQFSPTGALQSSSVNFSLNVPNAGAATPLSFSPNFTGVTGFASPSSVFTRDQNGSSSGTMTDASIGADGAVAGIFSNGTTSSIGQFRLVRFANPGGLIQVGDNLWAAGPNSGAPIAGVAGQGGFGRVVFGALEGSNVDLGDELVGQIVDKAFTGANLAAIKTENAMLGTLLDVLR